MSRPEAKLHQKCYKWFHNHYPELRKVMWYTENEGKRTKQQQMIVKSLGLTAGVSDMLFLYEGTLYGIEFKTKTGRQRDTQLAWQESIQEQGGKYHIIRTLKDFQKLIKNIVL